MQKKITKIYHQKRAQNSHKGHYSINMMWTLFILQLLTHLITFSSLLFFSSHFFCANFAKILRHTFIIFMSHTLPKCVYDFLVHACTHIAIIGFHVVHNKNFRLLHLTLPFYTLHNHLREALLWIIFFSL